MIAYFTLTASHNSHEKQHPGQITQVGDDPVLQEVQDTNPAVKKRHHHELMPSVNCTKTEYTSSDHYVTCKEITPA